MADVRLGDDNVLLDGPVNLTGLMEVVGTVDILLGHLKLKGVPDVAEAIEALQSQVHNLAAWIAHLDDRTRGPGDAIRIGQDYLTEPPPSHSTGIGSRPAPVVQGQPQPQPPDAGGRPLGGIRIRR